MTERGKNVSRHTEQYGSLCEGENKSGEQRKLRMDFKKHLGSEAQIDLISGADIIAVPSWVQDFPYFYQMMCRYIFSAGWVFWNLQWRNNRHK